MHMSLKIFSKNRKYRTTDFSLSKYLEFPYFIQFIERRTATMVTITNTSNNQSLQLSDHIEQEDLKENLEEQTREHLRR